FYQSAFQAELAPGDPCTIYPEGRTSLAIHIVDGDAPAESTDPLTPRCEFEVDDVDMWIERAVRNGGQLKCQIMDPHNRIKYAQWMDPFGYLWAVAAASNDE